MTDGTVVDPTLFFTDYTALRLLAKINVPPEQVVAVAVDVHGPADKTLDTDFHNTRGLLETITYTADADSGYSATVTFRLSRSRTALSLSAVLIVGTTAGTVGTATPSVATAKPAVIATAS